MDDLQDKRVFLTGAAGFIGANLARGLLRQGAIVHALVKPTTNPWRIDEIASRLVTHLGDLNDRAQLQNRVSQIRPEIVFHLAVPGGHPNDADSRIAMLQTSVLGTANLLEAIAAVDVQRFVHLGSSLEYDVKNAPLTESDRLEPTTFRGVAKAAATLLCQHFARANHRHLIALRVFSAYGYWESPTRLVPTAIRAALGDGEMPLTAPGYRHDMIFVQDVVEACLLALRAESAIGEIVNIGSGQQWSNEQIVETIQTVSGGRIRVRVGEYPARSPDTTHWVADIRRAKELLNWQPRHTLERGLEKTVAWFREHQDEYAKLEQRDQ